MKPTIGIPAHLLFENNKSSMCVGMKNILAIEKNGGIPVILPLCNDTEFIKTYIDKIDGIYFIGGNDVSPWYYGEQPIKNLGSVTVTRDKFEIELFKIAYKRKLPILGVCRGSQIINVASGGTLYQDIYSQSITKCDHSPNGIDNSEGYHEVKIDNNSKLFNITGEEKMFVNSLHHQAVKKLADIFRVSAFSNDNIIEAYESIENQFCMGIQWHPELMIEKDYKCNDIYINFIDECK